MSDNKDSCPPAPAVEPSEATALADKRNKISSLYDDEVCRWMNDAQSMLRSQAAEIEQLKAYGEDARKQGRRAGWEECRDAYKAKIREQYITVDHESALHGPREDQSYNMALDHAVDAIDALTSPAKE